MNWISNEHQRIKSELDSLGEKRIVCSSSFQTHSIPLLHVLGTVRPDIPVYFINTGFHFPETIAFKQNVQKLLNIKVLDIHPKMEKHQQLDSVGRFIFATDQDRCCAINKTAAMNELLIHNDVWISGLRKGQTAFRSQLNTFEPGAHNTLKYHPILEWTNKMIYEYRNHYELPTHPLEEQGYLSIGCEPCTAKFLGDERDGRWNGMKKTECGLHLDLTKD